MPPPSPSRPLCLGLSCGPMGEWRRSHTSSSEVGHQQQGCPHYPGQHRDNRHISRESADQGKWGWARRNVSVVVRFEQSWFVSLSMRPSMLHVFKKPVEPKPTLVVLVSLLLPRLRQTKEPLAARYGSRPSALSLPFVKTIMLCLEMMCTLFMLILAFWWQVFL